MYWMMAGVPKLALVQALILHSLMTQDAVAGIHPYSFQLWTDSRHVSNLCQV